MKYKLTTKLIKIMIIENQLKNYERLLNSLTYPKEFRDNLFYLLQLSTPSNGWFNLITALEEANSLWIPYVNSQSTWDDQLNYFKTLFKDKTQINQIIDRNIFQNESSIYGYVFSALPYILRVTIPLHVHDMFLSGNSTSYRKHKYNHNKIKFENNKIQYKDFLNLKELCAAHSNNSLINNNNIYYSKFNMNNEFCDYFRDACVTNEDVKHIQNISKFVSKIFINTYNNNTLCPKRHSKDNKCVTSTIKILFHSPNNAFNYHKNAVLSAAIHIVNNINTPPDFIYNKYIRNTKNGITENDDSKYWLTCFRRTVELCIGSYKDLPNELSGYTGRLFGTPLKAAARTSITTENITPNKTKSVKKPALIQPNTTKITPRKAISFPKLFPRKNDSLSNKHNSNKTIEETDTNNNILHNNNGNKVIQSSSDNSNKTKKRSISLSNKQHLTTQVDINYVPISVLYDFLAYVHQKNPLEHAYAWMCSHTGIKWKKVENLLISNDISLLNEKNILLNVHYRCINYKVIKGATPFEGLSKYPDITPDIMTLKIPSLIFDIITNSNKSSPFVKIGSKIERKANDFKHKNGGVPATPERLNATFRHLISHYGLTSLEQNLIRGEFDYSNRAKSNYPRFFLDDINNKYIKCLNNLYDEITKEYDLIINNNVFPLNFSSFDIPGSVGSLLAHPMHHFKGLVTAFKKSNHLKPLLKSKTIEDRINEIQHQHAYLYLMLQLILGLRPFGKETTIIPIPEYNVWIVRQKDSSNFYEKNLIAIPKIILSQVKQCDKSFESLIVFLKKINYNIKISDEKSLPYPSMFKLDSKTKSLVCTPITGSDLNNYLQQENLEQFTQGKHTKNNVYRHSLYTHLLDSVSDSFLSEHFQHHIGVHDLFSKFSNANLKQYLLLADLLDEIAQQLGFKVI